MQTRFQIAEAILAKAIARSGTSIACAESCTGGRIADTLTDVPGASRVFRGGIVAYSVDVKKNILGVPATLLEKFGVVSRECAEAMANGAAKTLGANWAVATTGVAGPGPQDGVPAGTVCIAVVSPDGVESEQFLFPNANRAEVKELAARSALARLLEKLDAPYDEPQKNPA